LLLPRLPSFAWRYLDSSRRASLAAQVFQFHARMQSTVGRRLRALGHAKTAAAHVAAAAGMAVLLQVRQRAGGRRAQPLPGARFCWCGQHERGEERDGEGGALSSGAPPIPRTPIVARHAHKDASLFYHPIGPYRLRPLGAASSALEHDVIAGTPRVYLEWP
jgi:hypothetical protein